MSTFHSYRFENSRKGLILLIVFFFFLGAWIPGSLSSDEPARNGARRLFFELQSLITEVANAVIPSVVHIEAIQKKNNRRSKVSGSGFIYSAEGYIVTNEHVVHHAEKVEVILINYKGRIPAKVVGTDKLTDLALLKIEPPTGVTLKPVKLGDDTKLRVGEWVLAIGNPYGLDGTVSFGIVSGKGRNFEDADVLNEFIQTDALIDYGSSGGPLLNLDGEVVGVNSMGQGRGIGFTIPISTVKEVVAKLLAGTVERGWMGIVIQPLDRDMASYMGLPDLSGAIISRVLPNSPAERARLQVGDIILEINGTPVAVEEEKDIPQFRRLVSSLPVGGTVPVTILSGRERKVVMVTLDRQPPLEGEEWETPYGFNVKELTEIMAIDLRLPRSKGVVVSFVERGSPASEGGLNPKDMILEVEGVPVTNLKDFQEVIKAHEGKSRFLMKVWRDEAVYWILIRPFGKPKS